MGLAPRSSNDGHQKQHDKIDSSSGGTWPSVSTPLTVRCHALRRARKLPMANKMLSVSFVRRQNRESSSRWFACEAQARPSLPVDPLQILRGGSWRCLQITNRL